MTTFFVKKQAAGINMTLLKYSADMHHTSILLMERAYN